MKHLLFTFAILLSFMSAHPHQPVPAPDFAFPKTVAKNAEADLKQAVKNDDPQLAINALVRGYIANALIDTKTIPQTIETTAQTAHEFGNSPLRGIFDVLLAQMYSTYYNQNSWRYDRRELPLEYLSKDMSEWSGAQFKQRIAQLCKQAYNDPRALSTLPITDYKDIITIDSLSEPYYPTLLDFVCQYSISLLQSIEDSTQNTQIIQTALDASAPGSAPYILWSTKKAESASLPTISLEKLFAENSDNPFAGIILSQYDSYISSFSNGETSRFLINESEDWVQNDQIEKINSEKQRKSWLVNQIDNYLQKFPDYCFKSQLYSIRCKLAAQKVTLQFNELCVPGADIEINVSNTNATSYSINIYKLNDNDLSKTYQFNDPDYFAGREPVTTIRLTSDSKIPFEENTTVTAKLEQTGHYAVVPVITGVKSSDARNNNVLWCIPAYPVTISALDKARAVVVNPQTGAPIVGANVSVVNKRGTVCSALTNANGIADISKGLADTKNWPHIVIKIDGKKYDFNNVNISNVNSPDKSLKYSASINTDRSLYHPGDKVQVMAVLSSSQYKGNDDFVANLVAKHPVTFTLYDANRQKIADMEATTDEFGRAIAEFILPTDGLTGQFRISLTNKANYWGIANAYITVSDYKMPDFEINVTSTARNVPSKGDVTIQGNATSYSGIPLSSVKVTATVSTASWWRWFSPQLKIYSAEVATDAEGKFSVLIPDSIFAENKNDNFFVAQLDAVSPSGTNAETSVPFSLGKQYMINLDAPQNIDATKPFTPHVSAIAPDGAIADIPLVGEIKKDGNVFATAALPGSFDLSKLTPGIYTLVVNAKDTELASEQTAEICIYNKLTDIVPSNTPIWIESNRYALDGKRKIDISYGTVNDQTTIYYVLSSHSKMLSLEVKTVKKGYHILTLDLPENLKDAAVQIFCVSNCQTYHYDVSLEGPVNNSIQIEGESFRDKLTPSTSEVWKIKVTQADGKPLQAALALDMYNKALDALESHAFALSFPRPRFYSLLNIDNTYNGVNRSYIKYSETVFSNAQLDEPVFRCYGYNHMFESLTSRNVYDLPMRNMSVRYSLASCDNKMEDGIDECAIAEAPMECMADLETDTGGQEHQATAEKFDFRDADVPMAVWAPSLTTNNDGSITYSFTVPNAITSWRLRALAWTKDLKIGTLMRDFVAQKPVMVQPNAPRFLRSGDISAISCLVINNTDSAASVTTTVEIFDPVTNRIISSQSFANDICANQQTVIDAPISAPQDAAAIGYRVKSSTSRFSDGEQAIIRILPAEADLIETKPFYLNPGQMTFTTALPDGKDARISLTFSENPAWTIVSAIPGLRDARDNDANSQAASLFSAAVARGLMDDNPIIAEALKTWRENPTDSALISMLEKNEDLKIALLNCTPWIQAAQSDTERMANLALIFDNRQTERAISNAIKALDKLQRSDGGWAWCEWSKESSEWVTANVLEMLGDLRRHNWLPSDSKLDDMISKALAYYDNKVKDTDWLYSLVRAPFDNIPVSANGKKVITATVKDINKHWKKYANPTIKAMAAEIIYFWGDRKKAIEIMSSLSEFGVWSESQGLTYPNVNSMASYGIILESYGLILPQSKEVDGLLQQLIVRKQATDWGSAVVTSQVVASILNAGTKWLVPAHKAKIIAGEQVVNPSAPIESFTGTMRADLSQYAGERLAIITSGSGPAYGAVYSQFKQTIDKVEAVSCDDLSITKQMWVRNGTEWSEITEPLAVGDRVKVQLTIHTNRNLDYVTVHDDRPAAFEPVDQLPGWLYSEGAVFYRENRDTFTGLYISSLRPGTYLLNYEMNVSHPGEYLSGVASIQSQYAPELSAHSSGKKFVVK